jgi:hypothetical protein
MAAAMAIGDGNGDAGVFRCPTKPSSPSPAMRLASFPLLQWRFFSPCPCSLKTLEMEQPLKPQSPSWLHKIRSDFGSFRSF